jgi:hypothetical protein
MKQETITNAHEMHNDSVLIIQAYVQYCVVFQCLVPLHRCYLAEIPYSKSGCLKKYLFCHSDDFLLLQIKRQCYELTISHTDRYS